MPSGESFRIPTFFSVALKYCINVFAPQAHARYLRQIYRLQQKHAFSGRMYDLKEHEVSLASIVVHAPKAAKLIAETVAGGVYQSQPATFRTIDTRGKARTVYSYSLTDMIVHGAIAEEIRQEMEPLVSPRLFSYRIGISSTNAIFDLAAYIRAYRARNPNPKSRGLYVLKRDIKSYGESIPIGAGSRIWELLEYVLTSAPSRSAISISDWELIEKVVRPEIRSKDGALFSNLFGIPDGQPISSVILNLYLTDLDQELERITGGFYARYSDDLLFLHPDQEVAVEVSNNIARILAKLELVVNLDKCQNLFLTGSGFRSPELTEFTGSTFIPFLGMQVAANGMVSLERKKARSLLRDVEHRALKTAQSLDGRNQDYFGQVVCSVINNALDPATPLYQQGSAPITRKVVTDRVQLAQLDYRIARIVLRAVTGDAGVRAFRQVPYRKMRQEWGLRSLVNERNRWGRG